MINHFKRSSSIISALLLTIVLVMLSRYVTYESGKTACIEPLSYQLLKALGSNITLKSVVIVILANLLAFFSYLINDRFIILNKRTYYPYFLAATLMVAGPYMQTLCSAPFFLLETRMVAGPYIQTLCSAHLGFILVFLAIYIILLNEEALNKNLNMMNASLILALSSFFQLQTLFFAPVLWIAASLQKSFSFKSFQASIVGMAIPYVVAFGYFYVFSSVEPILRPFRQLSILSHWQIKSVPEGFWLLFGGVSLLVFIGYLSFLRYRETLNTLSRRSLETFSAFMIFNLLFFGLGLWSLQSSLIYGSLSASIIISGLWIRACKRWRRLILYAYVVLLTLSFLVKF